MAERFWAVFDKTVTIMMVIGATLIIIDMLAVSVDVIVRYLVGLTYTGLFELTEYSLLWMTFLATAWLLKIDGHIKLDLVLDQLSPKHKAVTNIATAIIGEILLGFLIWYAAKLTVNDIQYGTYLSTVLQPIRWPIEIIIPIGYFLLFIVVLRKIFGYLKTWQTVSK